MIYALLLDQTAKDWVRLTWIAKRLFMHIQSVSLFDFMYLSGLRRED